MSFIGYAFMVYAFTKYYRLLPMIWAKIWISVMASLHGSVLGTDSKYLVRPERQYFSVQLCYSQCLILSVQKDIYAIH